ncbi:hypothetical protein TNCV_1072181 [Trichonephila clavipes]|nr:hypothetical protein TNCV_1072181 [Trichonephila clavipes]
MSQVRTLRLALIISSTATMESFEITMLAWHIRYRLPPFNTSCSQPYDLNSARHKLPEFTDRYSHNAHLFCNHKPHHHALFLSEEIQVTLLQINFLYLEHAHLLPPLIS